MTNDLFALMLEQHGCGGFEREYKVKNPRTGRSWKIDFAYPEQRVAVEFEGGVTVHGWHQSIERYASDCRKYSHLAADGWRVLRYTALDADEPVRIVAQIARALAHNDNVAIGMEGV